MPPNEIIIIIIPPAKDSAIAIDVSIPHAIIMAFLRIEKNLLT